MGSLCLQDQDDLVSQRFSSAEANSSPCNKYYPLQLHTSFPQLGVVLVIVTTL